MVYHVFNEHLFNYLYVLNIRRCHAFQTEPVFICYNYDQNFRTFQANALRIYFYIPFPIVLHTYVFDRYKIRNHVCLPFDGDYVTHAMQTLIQH